MGSGGVPVGSYRAAFIGTEKFDQNVEKYGEGIALKWKVIGGEQDGAEASRICSPRLTPKSTFTKFATSLKGSKLEAGERFSFEKYIGLQGMLLVEETDSGSTRVAAFIRDTAPPQQTQPLQQPQQASQQQLTQQPTQWESTQQQSKETF